LGDDETVRLKMEEYNRKMEQKTKDLFKSEKNNEKHIQGIKGRLKEVYPGTLTSDNASF
jgi:hypothetical protein